MPEKNSGLAWTQIVMTALITAVLSLIGSIAYFHYTNRAADLVYEVSPPATFSSQALQVSIYDASVENIGDKEAEEIEIYVALPASTRIQELVVRPNLASIKYTVLPNAAENERTVVVPRLNQGESIKLSLLADRETAAISKFEVRAKGAVSRVRPVSKDEDRYAGIVVLASFAAALLSGMVLVLLKASRVKARIDEAESRQREIGNRILEISKSVELNQARAEAIQRAQDELRRRVRPAEQDPPAER
jgi:hypothetical protein